MPDPDEQGDQHGKQQQRGAEVGLLHDQHEGHHDQRGSARARPRGDERRPHREVRTHASMSTKTILNSSDGCTVKGPRRIQRRAPDTVRPEDEHGTSRPSPST